MKIAIIHDWLVTYAGAEKVLESMINQFPDADLFSIVDYLNEDQRGFINNKKVNTSFIQKLPFSKSKYRTYLPLMPLAIEQFDLSKYDLIISSSHAVAKGVLTGPDQIHVSYVHTPIRYAWDLQHQYLKESTLNKGLKGIITKQILHNIRLWDYRTANGVDSFVANSHFISRRIKKIYGKEASVIYPPVDIDSFEVEDSKEDFYLTASRLVPYKKVDLIVEAFNKMPDKKLIVIGHGPEFKKIKLKAGKNIEMKGHASFEELKYFMKKAKAFVFAAEEDFGIVPVESQACGTPVIAFGKGGVTETVRNLSMPNPTGVYFYEQSVEAVVKCVKEFELNIHRFSSTVCRTNAELFSKNVFEIKFKEHVLNQFSSMNLKPEEVFT